MLPVRFPLLAWLCCVVITGCSSVSPPPLPPETGPFAVLRQVWSKEALVLHTAPDTASPPVRALPPGILFKVTSLEGNWYFVMVTDAVGGWGWVAAGQTTTAPPSAAMLQSAAAFQSEQFLREYYQNRYERGDWEKAQYADTVPAYLTYIEKYVFVTTSRCIPEAIDRVEELTWGFVERENTFESYTKYLEFFPVGAHGQQARSRLLQLLSTQRKPLPEFWKAFRQVNLPNLATTKNAVLDLRQQGQRSACPFTPQLSG